METLIGFFLLLSVSMKLILTLHTCRSQGPLVRTVNCIVGNVGLGLDEADKSEVDHLFV